MKKIFFFALASLALASCSQDEEFVAEKTNGSNRADKGALSFSTYTAGGTRAATVTSAEVQTSGFQVSAWYDGKIYFSDNALFENGLAIDNSSKITGAFDTEGDTYWWPRLSTTDTIGFRAFNNLTAPAAWTDANCLKLKYTVQPTAAAQEDLVIAYAVASEKPAEGVQPLNFTHALSKVNFSFVGSNADYKYTINKVEVIAAGQNDAVMSFAETTENGGTDGAQPTTNAQANKAAWSFTAIDGTVALVKKEAGAPANQGVLYTYYSDADGVLTADFTDQNFMLLPQTGKIAVRVYYKVEDKNNKLIGNCGYVKTDKFGRHEGQTGYDATTAIYGCKTVVINLGTDKDNSTTPADIPAWVAGKAYRFTMTLPADNFIGDLSEDQVPDGLDSTDPSAPVDLDGDNDTDASEFDQLTPIRFSVTVSDWVVNDPATSNITIK